MRTTYDDEGETLSRERLAPIARAIQVLNGAQRQYEDAVEAAGFLRLDLERRHHREAFPD